MDGGKTLGYLLVKDLREGMILDQTIQSPGGEMVIGKGSVLNRFLISSLQKWNVKGVVISENEPKELSFSDIEKLLTDITQSLENKTATADQKDSVAVGCQLLETELQRVFLLTRYLGLIPIDAVYKVVREIHPLLAETEFLSVIHTDAPAGNYLYRHALDVAGIAGYIGRWLGYGEEEIQHLLFAGLMHDIGKARVKFEILSKPNKLNREELNIAKKHSQESRQLLEQAGVDQDEVLKAIFQHHERMDGSGYPVGLQGKDINWLAKIIAVADVYDALISNRYYRRKVSWFMAAETMLHEMKGQFDAAVLSCLLEHIRDFSLGKKVVLSNQKTGKIISFPPLPCMKPLVETIDGEIVDLACDAQIQILEMILDS
jgi:putative nucleotidyltransferase with HDIG domain